MLYINPNISESGGYSSPQSSPANGLLLFPENLLDKFIECKGFVKLTVKDRTVTAIKVNTKALEAWEATQTEQGAE